MGKIKQGRATYADHTKLLFANYKLAADGQVIFSSMEALKEFVDGVHAQLLQKIAILELSVRDKGGI